MNKTSPKSPKLFEFQRELKSLEKDTHESEMDLADFKRFALKEAFYLRFNAMNEYAEKTALIAGFGKYLTDLINIEPTPVGQQNRSPYDKGAEAAIIFADAMNAINHWKPLAQDERPTMANMVTDEQEAAAAGKGKGKQTDTAVADPQTPVTPAVANVVPPAAAATTSTTEPTTTTQQQNSPPQLPPRRPTIDATTTPSQPSGYTTDEISNVTGDYKSSHEPETEIDLARIDLYDAPPPAYDGPPTSSSSQPLNSDRPYQQQDHYTFSSPYQPNAQLPPAPQPAHQQSLHYSDSPSPMHLQTPQMQHHHYQHQDSTMYDPNGMMYNTQVNYQQLYRQVSQRRQQQQAYCRPYAEFQQQFVDHGDQQQGYGYRQRVDAGGFRVPQVQQHESAEDEKERLAQHYRQQEEYGNNAPSHYGGSQYGGSQYGGSQYGGSQYGGSQHGGSQYGGNSHYGGGLASAASLQQRNENQAVPPVPPIHHQLSQHSPNTAATVDPQALQKPNNYEQKIAAEEEEE